MVKGNGPKTSENPVIVHLFPFWTEQPIYPEGPEAEIREDPLLATLLHPG
jgi:hypothetical protein